MKPNQPLIAFNETNEDGMPEGGTVHAPGLEIIWQNGPLGRGAERKEPNGCFIETPIHAALQRLQYMQQGPFKCRENAVAITKLEEALMWLQHRSESREDRGVEGTRIV